MGKEKLTHHLGRTAEYITRGLEDSGLRFALCGGLAASVYRDEARLTKDIDFILSESHGMTELAEKLFAPIQLKATALRQAQLDGGPMFAIKRKSTSVSVIVGRDPNDKDAFGIDFLLPTIPWVLPALERAQYNKIDFGFATLPTISVEDLIVAKLISAGKPSREKDIDDLRSIARAGHSLDTGFLCAKMREHRVTLPQPVEKEFSYIVQQTSRAIEREHKRGRGR